MSSFGFSSKKKTFSRSMFETYVFRRWGSYGNKNDSYETIIQRLLRDSLTENELITGWLVNQPEDIKACFYMGVLLAKVFDNPARSKHWETLKKLKKRQLPKGIQYYYQQ